MSAKQIHIINHLKLELNVQASRGQDYYAINERLSVLGQERIPEIIDRVLSELVPPGVYVRYDKLLVDCDISSLEELEEVIRRQLAGELELLIREQAQDEELRFASVTDGREDLREAIIGPGAWVIHFLEKGVLPWSAPEGTSPASLAYELTELLANDPAFAEGLRRFLLQNKNGLKRMLAQFGSVMLQRLMGAAQDQPMPPPLLSLTEQLKYWTEQLELWEEAIEVNRSMTDPKNKVEAPRSKEQKRLTALVQGNHNQEKALAVRQAGLVLLHPFIDRFLTLHGAVSNHEVVDPSLAASLLQSLVAGESPTAEWELVLPKVLLDIPLEEVLVLPKLTEEQLRSGEELIEAAIRHWSALGRTSVAGFRANFLRRDGLLHLQGADWYLQIAHAPYDMLLDRLPWNIAMIKLPWMRGMLKVDFQ
ncbi:contractile injection system tape measure protein [Lewinella sp. LCG006]|uniref:contractile injection system tape measure protein n=1 Tax=Lewinella sp. LCG006 TaxID=3231911 RepID=UPI0034600123